MTLVDKPLFNTVSSGCVLRKTFHSPPVLENLCAQQKGKHVHFCCNTFLYLELLHHVLDRCHFRHYPMYATPEDLETFNDDRSLFRQDRCGLVNYNIQRRYSFCNFDPPYAISLETTDPMEKEDLHDSNICDRFPVRVYRHTVIIQEEKLFLF